MSLDPTDVLSAVFFEWLARGMWHMARGSSVSEAAKKQVAGSCCKHVQVVADSVFLCFWNQNLLPKDQAYSQRLFLEYILPFLFLKTSSKRFHAVF